MATLLMLSPADHGRAVSLEEFEASRGEDGYQYEIIHGKVYVSPKPNLPHDLYVKWFVRQLDRYVEVRPEVINFVSPNARVVVPGVRKASIPEPDLAAYHDVPADVPIEEMAWGGISPILVGEVLSTDDPDKDLVRNVALYERVPSIREYWIVDRLSTPFNFLVYRRRGKHWQKPIQWSAGAEFSTPLLPGFHLFLEPRIV
jgi:Uma2 family endonuclease